MKCTFCSSLKRCKSTSTDRFKPFFIDTRSFILLDFSKILAKLFSISLGEYVFILVGLYSCLFVDLCYFTFPISSIIRPISFPSSSIHSSVFMRFCSIASCSEEYRLAVNDDNSVVLSHSLR